MCFYACALKALEAVSCFACKSLLADRYYWKGFRDSHVLFKPREESQGAEILSARLSVCFVSVEVYQKSGVNSSNHAYMCVYSISV